MRVAVCGGAGFIGRHLSSRLVELGNEVVVIDKKQSDIVGASSVIADLRDDRQCREIFAQDFDQVYQLAADMGGAGYIFTGDNDYKIISDSTQININVANNIKHCGAKRLFFSSSACVYPKERQSELRNLSCEESTAYPANPDSDYGWQKLFSERLFSAFSRASGVQTRIARYHNVYGQFGAWNDGREKAPAALCRKVALASSGDCVDVWGTGLQTRSFLHVDDCVDATILLMASDISDPVNIGSEEMVTINELARIIIEISGKKLSVRNIDGPVGVNYRVSDNSRAAKYLCWLPKKPLAVGLRETYAWISEQCRPVGG